MRENNNAALIPALREAADYLEAHPEIPEISIAWLMKSLFTKDQLRQAAKAMGSCLKRMDDQYFKLVREFGPLRLEICVDRELMCKKIVTWDCPDDESLLKELDAMEVKNG